MTPSPCRDCTGRCLYCNSKCKLYEDWQRERLAIKVEQSKERRLDNAIIEQRKNREIRRKSK